VAKKVKLVSVKIFPDDENEGARTDDIIKALEWVKEDARGKKAVVNMSLGGPKQLALNAAVAAVVRSGILVCVAAGNEHVSISSKLTHLVLQLLIFPLN
jgi:subtilisin family serine protease